MSAVDVARTPSALGAWARDERLTLAAFTLAIFLSASLLFSVEPMFAKMVLPKLGGSPSVWAVSMCFFQAVLLAGYCYAHALNRLLAPGLALIAHLAVLVIATIALPIGLPALALTPPPGAPYLWLVGVLGLGVGLPFFAVSANAPLLQSWYARTGHEHARDPYFLYGASNLGSLLVLLSYPLIIEPVLGLGAQGRVWAQGFLLLAAVIAGCGTLMLANSAGWTRPVRAIAVAGSSQVTSRARAVWVALAFVPSALLVAFTTYLTTDIASAPLLWVVPLAMFLATFILVFRETPVISQKLLTDRQPFLVALAIFGSVSVVSYHWALGLGTGLLAFSATMLICHRELYLRRPAASHLTEFYLWMSAGGVLGGIFSALIAPQLFSTIAEFPLLVAAGLIGHPYVLEKTGLGKEWRQVAQLVAAGAAVLLATNLLIAHGILPAHMKLRTAVAGGLIGLMLLYRNQARVLVAAISVMLLAMTLLPEGSGSNVTLRSFFGVHRVLETPDHTFRLLMHGTTVHGAERLLSVNGEPITRPVPATYYDPFGTMTRAVGLARDAMGAEGRALRGGVVGLGAGAMACNTKPSDAWRFYEIDEAVVRIARDPKLFHFLSACRPDADIVLGDARLTVAKEPAAAFDYLLVDAFSSDAIPTHLLTVEALRMFLDKVADRGVLAVHLSNRHLDLPPIVAATLRQIPGIASVLVRYAPANPGYDTSPSTVVLISRQASVLEPALSWPGAAPLADAGKAAWTDDYSNILSALSGG